MNNEQGKKKVKDKIKYIQEENTWAMKLVIGRKLIDETVRVKCVKLDTYTNCTERLRELKQDYQNTNDPKEY